MTSSNGKQRIEVVILDSFMILDTLKENKDADG